jgi:hypothetical protein
MSDNVPLNGPLHGVVTDEQGRGDKQHLRAEAAPGIEDCGVQRTSQRALCIGTQCVGGHTLLRLRAWDGLVNDERLSRRRCRLTYLDYPIRQGIYRESAGLVQAGQIEQEGRQSVP